MVNKIKEYIKLARVHHYIKNVLIAIPAFFGGCLTQPRILGNVLIGIAIFSLISSGIYIFNDIMDADADMQNPTKKNRPIACGAVSKREAAVLGAVLVLCTVIFGGLLLLRLSLEKVIYAMLLTGVYYGLNIAYSIKLKHIPIIDIAVLVSGFFIRVLFGSVVSGVAISSWLYLMIISLSFYLAVGKRRNEMIYGSKARSVLKYYNEQFLNKNMYVFMGLSIAFYALWSKEGGDFLRICSVPVVMLILIRYSYIIEKEEDGDPTGILLHDKPIWVLGALYGIIIVMSVYL